MITLQHFQSQLDLSSLNHVMEETCRDAALTPKATYVFMHRFVHYCRDYSVVVPILASTIGSSNLFRDRHAVHAHADRSMDVAASVFAASIEEFRDPRTGVSHRTLSYALLDALAEYANLSAREIQQIAESGDWLIDICQQVKEGYRAKADDLESLVRAIGFHTATETVGLNECSIINTAIFSKQRNQAFGQFIKSKKVRFHQGTVSPWYWIVIHGTDHTKGVEIEHALEALQAVDQAVQYCNASEEEVIEWAGQGFAKFAHVQTEFFKHVQKELQAYVPVLAAV